MYPQMNKGAVSLQVSQAESNKAAAGFDSVIVMSLQC